jgi:cyclase
MLQKRIVVCLDVKEGRTTKGVKFANNLELGDPVQMAERYYHEGVDELVFYDITASSDKRPIMIDVVRRVAQKIFIPFCVGGGIKTANDIRQVILAGAEKVSLNSQAVLNPELIREGARLYGSQSIVLALDVKADPAMPSGYRVVINGGRTPTDLDALVWALRGQELGAGEIVLNSIDADGTKAGYDLVITRKISDALTIPVVASGGAGTPEHLRAVLQEGHADAALVASMVHYGTWSLGQIKASLAAGGVPVRQVDAQVG